eukprot:15470351-Alexandrium_andersonii.AAC.1
MDHRYGSLVGVPKEAPLLLHATGGAGAQLPGAGPRALGGGAASVCWHGPAHDAELAGGRAGQCESL